MQSTNRTFGQSLSDLLGEYDAEAPLDLASTIPSSWYLNPQIADLERACVFGGAWQVAGRLDQVEKPGQFFTIEIAGEPLLIVRGADGKLRGFFNVCRHHAAAVAEAEEGSTRVFRCPYHGWTYALDGSLLGTPDFGGVCGFDRAQNGLVPVRVDTWESFVWVNISKQGASLRDSLGDLEHRLASLNLSQLKFRARREYEIRCNWKVFVDNYLDGGYHVPYLHKALNSVLDYAGYTVENGDRYCLQWSPIVSSGENAEVSSTRTGDRAYYYWIYPNFMLNIYAGVMDTNLVLPLGIDRTRIIFDFYFQAPPADGDGNSAPLDADASIAVSDVVQQEDIAVCEAVQRGLGSRAYTAGRLSVRREAGEHLFHRLLARDLNAGCRR